MVDPKINKSPNALFDGYPLPEGWPGDSDGWNGGLSQCFKAIWWRELMEFVESERQSDNVFPSTREVFQAYRLTPLSEVKFVILGQDPYHGEGQAHGLSFSVKDEVKIPPSLRNIFAELNADIGVKIPNSGDLSVWALRGGLLLNTVLTVRSSEAHSHRGKGWERFTDATIQLVNQECQHVAFVLWGSPARKKKSLIDAHKHLIIESPHPSPLSAYRGFLGSKPFSAINKYRADHDLPLIDWRLNNHESQGSTRGIDSVN